MTSTVQPSFLINLLSIVVLTKLSGQQKITPTRMPLLPFLNFFFFTRILTFYSYCCFVTSWRTDMWTSWPESKFVVFFKQLFTIHNKVLSHTLSQPCVALFYLHFFLITQFVTICPFLFNCVFFTTNNGQCFQKYFLSILSSL